MKNLFVILFCISFISVKTQEVFNSNIIHEVRISFSESNFWHILSQNYELSETLGDHLYLMGNVEIDGVAVDSVGIRQKGIYSHQGFPGKKKPLKIDFNEFVKGKKFQGLKKLNLANFAADPTMMRDMLSYKIHELKGNLFCRNSYAKVYLNDEFWGLYLIVEQIDKTYLKTNFEDDDGNLYKSITKTGLRWIDNDFNSYSPFIELKTNKKKKNHEAFISFLDVLNHKPEDIASVFDMPSFLSILSVDITLNNWDSYYDNEQNFYLYHNPKNNTFYFIPWDYNLAFWVDDPYNLIPIQKDVIKPLLNIIKNSDKYTQMYYDNFCVLLDSIFTEEALFPILDNTKKLIENTVKADTNKFYSQEAFNLNIENSVNIVMPRNGVNTSVFLPGLKNFIQVKRQKLREQLVQNKASCYLDETYYIAYPNPTKNILYLKYSGKEATIRNIQIFNSLGEQMQVIDNPQTLQFDFSTYNTGLYFMSIRQKNNKTKKLKFILK